LAESTKELRQYQKPSPGDIANSLKENFKLSSYETKAYLSLLKLGKQNPKQVSSNAGVPMPRVYDTLESLMSKGFVIKQDDNYLPISPRTALHGRSLQFDLQFAQEQKSRQAVESELIEVLENIENSKSKGSAEANEISVLKGFNSIANKFSELLENSNDIILMAKRAVEAKEIFIPILLEFGGAGNKKRKIRIIIPKETKITEEEIKVAKQASTSIRRYDYILFDMMITDSDDIVIGVPDPLSEEINHAIAIWVRNSSFAKSTRASVEEIWKRAEHV